MTDLVPVRRALISLSDKTGLEELAAGLARHDVELVSTGGTAAKLRELGHEVRDISDLTGFPEMMDGRVKTLHPKVHGGLLGVRDNPEHAAAMAEHGIAADRPRRRQPLPVPEDADARRRPRRRSSRISTSAARRWSARRPRTMLLSRSSPIRPIMPRCSPSWTANGGATTLDLRKRLAAKAYRADRRL